MFAHLLVQCVHDDDLPSAVDAGYVCVLLTTIRCHHFRLPHKHKHTIHMRLCSADDVSVKATTFRAQSVPYTYTHGASHRGKLSTRIVKHNTRKLSVMTRVNMHTHTHVHIHKFLFTSNVPINCVPFVRDSSMFFFFLFGPCASNAQSGTTTSGRRTEDPRWDELLE